MPEQIQLHRLKVRGTRGRYFQSVLRLPALYKAYRENVLRDDKRAINNQKDYADILRLANKKMMEAIILESKEVTFPFGMGSLRVVKKKIDLTNLKVNWLESNKLPKGQLVYHLNEHTDGFGMSFYWDKKRSSVANIGAYSFVSTSGPKGNRRFLSQTILGDNPVDYIEKRTFRRPKTK